MPDARHGNVAPGRRQNTAHPPQGATLTERFPSEPNVDDWVKVSQNDGKIYKQFIWFPHHLGKVPIITKKQLIFLAFWRGFPYNQHHLG